MKKVLAVLLAAAFAVSALGGCSGQTNTGSAASADGASAQASEGGDGETGDGEVISIELPSYRCGTDEPSKFFLGQIDRFNEKYAGKYEVVGVYSGGGDDHNEKIKQLGMQGSLPPVFQFSDFTYAEKNFFKDDVLYDMSEWLEETPELKNVFVPSGWEKVTQPDGSIYALPLAIIRPEGLYYNTQGFTPSKKLSEMTWEELGSELKAQNALYGVQTAEQGWTMNLTISAMMANIPGGLEIMNEGLKERITDFNNDTWKQAFTQLKALYDAAGWTDGLGKTYPDVENAFLNNVVSMLPNGQWVITGLSIEDTNWGEGYDGTKVCADIFPGNVAIANPGTYDWYLSAQCSEEEREVGKAFLEFINTQEELEAMALSEGGSIPQLEPTEDFLEKVAENKVLSDFANAVNEDTIYVPHIHEVTTTAVMDAFGANLPAFLMGDMSVDELCQALTNANE